MKTVHSSGFAAILLAAGLALTSASCAITYMAAPMGHEVMPPPVLCLDEESTKAEDQLWLGVQAGAAYEYILWDSQLKTGLQWNWGKRESKEFALNGELELDGWINYTDNTVNSPKFDQIGGLGGGIGAQAGLRFLHGSPVRPMFIHGPLIQYSWEGGEFLAQRQALASLSASPTGSEVNYMNISPWGHTLSFLYSWEVSVPSRDGVLVVPGFSSGLILSDVYTVFSGTEAAFGSFLFSPLEATLGVKFQWKDVLGWIKTSSVISVMGAYFGAMPKYTLDLGLSFRL